MEMRGTDRKRKKKIKKRREQKIEEGFQERKQIGLPLGRKRRAGLKKKKRRIR